MYNIQKFNALLIQLKKLLMSVIIKKYIYSLDTIFIETDPKVNKYVELNSDNIF